MKPFIIGLTGKAGSGKDTVALMLTRRRLLSFGPLQEEKLSDRIHPFKKAGFKQIATGNFGPAFHMAMADPLKMIPHILYNVPYDNLWGEKKEETIPGLKISARKLLQDMGTYYRKLYTDTWVDLLMRTIDITHKKHPGFLTYVISDVRYDNEAEAVRARGGVVWEIVRPDLDTSEPWRAHSSESGVSERFLTRRILNNKTLGVLYDRVKRSYIPDYLEYVSLMKNDETAFQKVT